VALEAIPVGVICACVEKKDLLPGQCTNRLVQNFGLFLVNIQPASGYRPRRAGKAKINYVGTDIA
jgi:hypothetical protein